METRRLLACLADDYTRLHEVVSGADLTAKVPSCPEWTVNDLARHVGVVYLHKVECMRHNAAPAPWPPAELADEPTLALLERAYGELSAEFATRPADSPAFTWFEQDQTVGFWIRRMAQETVIHRVDGELGTGSPIAPIPDDLAVDGMAEFLEVFIGYGTRVWHADFAELLARADGRSVSIEAGGQAWLVRPLPDRVEVSRAESGVSADASVHGGAGAVLLWLWNRARDEAVTLGGDATVIAYFQQIVSEGGQ
jgi:uncharacterized protein (TIGR03083 family)